MKRQKFVALVGVLAATFMVVAAVQGLTAEKYLITIIAGEGSPGYSGDGGPATAAAFNTYDGGSLALDASGSIYIGDQANARIRKIDPSGIITTVAGNGTGGYSGDGGPATAAQLYWPYSVAVDASGILYIADMGIDRFRKVDASGIITSFEVSELLGGHGKYPGHTEGAGSNRAMGVLVDKDGILYCWTPAVIAKISPSGAVSTIAWNGLDMFWAAVCLDPAGNLYVFDYWPNQLIRVDAAGKRTVVAGNGNREYAGDGGPALKASFQNLHAMAIDSAGNIYISDVTKPEGGKNVIRKVDAKTGAITKIPGGGYFTTSAVGGPATGASLGTIGDIEVDKEGNVYLLDLTGLIWKLYQ